MGVPFWLLAGSQRPRKELGGETLRNTGGGGDRRFATDPVNGTFNLSYPPFTDTRKEHEKEEEEGDVSEDEKQKGAGVGVKPVEMAWQQTQRMLSRAPVF